MTHLRSILILAVLASLFAGCGKNACNTPIGDVTSTIYLLNPDAYNLLHAGGAVKAVGGNKGMWIVNTGAEYVVFEATCPYCLNVSVDTVRGYSGILQCPTCETMYSTYTNGYPVEGSQTQCPLYQYSCTVEGNYLHIYN